MQRTSVIVGAALVAALLAPAPAAQASHLPSGYNLYTECKNPGAGAAYDTWDEARFSANWPTNEGIEDRILLEEQVWWFPTSEDFGGTATGDSMGHVHTSACVPDWKDDAGSGDPAIDDTITDRYLTMHALVEIHLADCQPGPCGDNFPQDYEAKMNQFQFRGHNDGAVDEEIDTFDTLDQSILTCSKGKNCKFFFEFTNTNQSAAPSYSVENNTSTNYDVRIVLPEVDLYDSVRIPASDTGFEYNGTKQLRMFPIVKEYNDSDDPSQPMVHEANMRAIVRSPLRLNITGPLPESQCGSPCQQTQYLQVEGSGWWVNKEGSANNDPGGGGYATVEYNDGAPMAAYPTARLPVTYPLSADYVYQMPVATNGEVSVRAEPCNVDCIVQRRDLSGFRTYIDPRFQSSDYAEQDDREKNICFDIHGGTTTCGANGSPNFPEVKHTSTPYAEEDGTEDYSLTNNQRKVTFTFDTGEDPLENAAGLHKVAVVVRMPTQTDDHDADGIYDEPGSYAGHDVPSADESTLFGVFVQYVTMRD